MNFFDNNPWKFFVIMLAISNFMFLFNSEIVLSFVLFVIFLYIAFLSTSKFKSYVTKKKNSDLKIFDSLFRDISKIYDELELDFKKKASLFIDFKNSSNLWLLNSVSYRCIWVSKIKNYCFTSMPSFVRRFLSKKKNLILMNLKKENFLKKNHKK